MLSEILMLEGVWRQHSQTLGLLLTELILEPGRYRNAYTGRGE